MTIRQDTPRRWEQEPELRGLNRRDPATPAPDPVTPVQHTETAVEARQGWLDRPMLVVLIAGLVLAAIFVVAMNIWSDSEDLPPAGQIEDSPAIVDDAAPAPVDPDLVVPAEPAG
jgi:hypothetical protein